MSVFVVYRLRTVLHDRTVGLVAALLCAFYPLEVINGTRILSDVQVGLFASIGLLLFVEAMRRRSVVMCGLSGAATAGAYLATLSHDGHRTAPCPGRVLLREVGRRNRIAVMLRLIAMFATSLTAISRTATTTAPAWPTCVT